MVHILFEEANGGGVDSGHYYSLEHIGHVAPLQQLLEFARDHADLWPVGGVISAVAVACPHSQRSIVSRHPPSPLTSPCFALSQARHATPPPPMHPPPTTRVMLIARWVTLRARWVTLRAR